VPNTNAGDAEPERPDFAGPSARDDANGIQPTVPRDGWSPLWSGLARVGGVLPPAGRVDADPWALLRGRRDTPGGGRPHGSTVGTTRSRFPALGPCFDADVPSGGYSWWYIDAISDDGTHGLTIIAFIGSVFSPYYKASGRGNPLNHCSLNVALYGPRASRWAMTERSARFVSRDTSSFAIGPSAVRWDGTALVIDIDERAMPLPFRVRGRVRVEPEILGTSAFALTPGRRHVWHPIAPRARVEARFDAPDLRWSGNGYLDSNRGSESLEEGFSTWEWSRAHIGKDVGVIYEGNRRDGSEFAMALRCDRTGKWVDEELPPQQILSRTPVFAMPRSTRVDPGYRARVRKTWEDTPFYSRSSISTRLFGADGEGVHESLSLDRFVSPIVQRMLPFRMPRRS